MPAPQHVLACFQSCPIAARFIDTREDALSYYAHRLVGGHRITTRGVAIIVRFNPEETHCFTEVCASCSQEDVVARAGASREVRCLSRERARLLDQILPTIADCTVAHRANTPGGILLYGPSNLVARRMCVVVAPANSGAVHFVRTAYPVSGKDFARAVRSGRPTPWPPK